MNLKHITWGIVIVAVLAIAGAYATDDFRVYGNFQVDGKADVDGALTADDLTASDDLVVTDDASIGGVLTVVTVTGSGNVTGVDLISTDDVLCGDDVVATGNVSGVNITGSGTVQGADLDATDDLTVADDATVSGEFLGARLLLCVQKYGTTSGDAWMQVGVAAMDPGAAGDGRGLVMPRAGSIVSVSASTWCNAQTTAGTVGYDIYVDTTQKWIQQLSIDGATEGYAGYSTQARGTDTFTAGQMITVQQDLETFVGTLQYSMVLVEVQFND